MRRTNPYNDAERDPVPSKASETVASAGLRCRVVCVGKERQTAQGRQVAQNGYNASATANTWFIDTKHPDTQCLKPPYRIGNSQSAAHFRCELLDERQVIPIKLIAEVESVKGNDVRRMLAGDQIRP